MNGVLLALINSIPLQVTIFISDLNDMSPQFTQTLYYKLISEGVRSGSDVIQVQAVDRDWGVNGKVVYSIINSIPSNGTGMTSLPKSNSLYRKIVKEIYESWL